MGNVAMISGNVVKDGELRVSNGGNGYFVPFSVITDRRFKNRHGVLEHYSVRHRVVVYGVESYLRNHVVPHAKRGTFVTLVGEIRNKTFDGHDGNRVNLSEIVVYVPGGSIEFPQLKDSEVSHGG